MIIAIITAINVTVFSFEMFIHFHSLTITLYHAIASKILKYVDMAMTIFLNFLYD